MTARARVLTTAYCPCAKCCGKWADGTTALGRDVHEHPLGIASDHAVVPPWTWVDVPGYGRAQVDDTGSAMKASARDGVIHLDLRFLDHDEALRWGRQWLWVTLGAPEGSLENQR